MHRRIKNLIGSPPSGLGAIERNIRITEQIRRIGVAGWPQTMPMLVVTKTSWPIHLRGPIKHRENAFGHLNRRLHIGQVLYEDDKLVSPQAGG
jgi:hypothetical protein